MTGFLFLGELSFYISFSVLQLKSLFSSFSRAKILYDIIKIHGSNNVTFQGHLC